MAQQLFVADSTTMSPALTGATYASEVPGMNAISGWDAKVAAVMSNFYGTAPPVFGTDRGMSPAYHHELTYQSLVGNRSVLQERLAIRRSLNPLKIGLRVLAPMVLVNALKIHFERTEELPVLISHGAERTTGRGTQRRSEMREEQLDRWMGGDQFGIDALIEDASVLDASRATNIDGLLSSLDFNVWAEARRAHDMAYQQDSSMYKGNGVTSFTSHMVEMARERFNEFTFAFHRYDAVMTRLTNQIEMWQKQYQGAGDTWFLHLFSDLAMRNANTGPGKEFEYFRYGPGALERRTAALGETLPAEVPGKQVYLMSSTDIAGVRGLDVMERTLTLGEFYVQGYPNFAKVTDKVLTSDMDIELMTVSNDKTKTMWAVWSALDSINACGMYDASGKPRDIINHSDFANRRQAADASFQTQASKIHSLYYADPMVDSRQSLVKFMGQLEQFSFSTRSLLKLARSVIANLNTVNPHNGIAKLQKAIRISKRYLPSNTKVIGYLDAMVKLNIGDDKAKKSAVKPDGGLRPIIPNLKEYWRNEHGGWDLPETEDKAAIASALASPAASQSSSSSSSASAPPRADDTKVDSAHGFELPPKSHSWGMLRSVASARARANSETAFSKTYGLSYSAATDVADGLTAFEEISDELKRLLPGSVFNDARYAPDYVWSPTDAAALYHATLGADSLPVFHKGVPVTTSGALDARSKVAEAASVGDVYARALQQRFTGKLSLTGEEGRLIQANINKPKDTTTDRIVLEEDVTSAVELADAVLPIKTAGSFVSFTASKATSDLKDAYFSLVGLMFNVVPIGLDADVAARAERDRTVLLILANAIKAGGSAEEQAKRINVLFAQIIIPALGIKAASDLFTTRASHNGLWGNTNITVEEIRAKLNEALAASPALKEIFTVADLRSAANNIQNVYVEFERNKKNAAPVTNPLSPGEWRRTPLMAGREQFVAFKEDGNWLPADPGFVARVIPLNVYAAAKSNLPNIFKRGAELRGAVPELGLARHYKTLLANMTPEQRAQTDPFTGRSYQSAYEMYGEGQGNSDFAPMDVMSGQLPADVGSLVTPEDFAGMVSESFKQHWIGVTADAKSALEEVVAKAFMGQVHSKQTLEAAAVNDTVIPVRFLLARLLHLRTISALYAMRGGVAMQTPFTAPRFYQGQTVSTQEFSYNFHLWAKPVVLNADYLYWVDHVQIRSYIGGWTLNPALPDAVAEVTDPDRLAAVGDLYVMVQPFENTPYPSLIPITGHREDYIDTVPNDVASKTAAVYPNAYATEILFGFSNLARQWWSDESNLSPGNSSWVGNNSRLLPNFHMGTARFDTQHGRYIQYSSSPLESQFVNNNMYKALCEGKDRFHEESLLSFKSSPLTPAPRALPAY